MNSNSIYQDVVKNDKDKTLLDHELKFSESTMKIDLDGVSIFLEI